MGVINNYFLITFQISYELQLPLIIINTLKTDKEFIVHGCYKCLTFYVLMSFYEKLRICHMKQMRIRTTCSHASLVVK